MDVGTNFSVVAGVLYDYVGGDLTHLPSPTSCKPRHVEPFILPMQLSQKRPSTREP